MLLWLFIFALVGGTAWGQTGTPVPRPDNQVYDFSAIVSTGQTLYFNYLKDSQGNYILDENGNFTVEVTYRYGNTAVGSKNKYEADYFLNRVADAGYNGGGTISSDGYIGTNNPTNNSGVVVIPETVIDPNDNVCVVTVVGTHAFEWCEGITSLIIPQTVTTIGDYAFKATDNLVSISLPENLDHIGTGIFSGGLINANQNDHQIEFRDTMPPILDGDITEGADWIDRIVGYITGSDGNTPYVLVVPCGSNDNGSSAIID